LERDPEEYVDGLSLYEYVASRPITSLDPFGLRELTDAERTRVCRALYARHLNGTINSNDFQAAWNNFECNGVSKWRLLKERLTDTALACTGGDDYNFLDCMGECISDTQGLVEHFVSAAGLVALLNIIPGAGTGELRNLNPIPRKRMIAPGQTPNTTSWFNLWKDLPPGLQKQLSSKLMHVFRAVGRANVAMILIEGAFAAAVEGYCANECRKLPPGQRYQRTKPASTSTPSTP
jgi:hypothetical protein